MEEILKNSLLRSFQTDNIIINTIGTGLIITITSYIFSQLNIFSIYFKKILNFFRFKKKVTAELEFNCSETKSYYGGTIMSGSTSFKALLWFIKEKIKENKIIKLNQLKEYHEGKERYDDDDDDNDEERNEILYIVNQEEEFEFEDDKIGKVYIIFEKNEENMGNDDQRKLKTSYNLLISSKTVDLKVLQEYVEQIRIKYIANLNYIINKKQFIFELENEAEDGDLEFEMYPFDTTCSMDKIYFDDKEEILNQILFFKDNKSWYEKHGKPYTLGICSYGFPGCGKTSFEKCVTKMLNRHMIKVDLSKCKNKSIANKLFFSERINEFKIPYDKRIYVFSEVDRMSEILFKEEFKKKDETMITTNFNQSRPVIINNNQKEDAEKIKSKSLSSSEDDGKLNLYHILDILDGIPERTGQIIMMSTNNFEKLDTALIRPGRIDCAIHFRKCTVENVKKLIEDYYEKPIEIPNEIEDRKWSPAEIFQICSKFKNPEDVLKKLVEEKI
jgi:hypothetical protein